MKYHATEHLRQPPRAEPLDGGRSQQIELFLYRECPRRGDDVSALDDGDPARGRGFPFPRNAAARRPLQAAPLECQNRLSLPRRVFGSCYNFPP